MEQSAYDLNNNDQLISIRQNFKVSDTSNKIEKKEHSREIFPYELRIDDIKDMKEKLDSLNPNKIIEDILKKSKRKESVISPQDKKMSNDDYLNNLKNNAMNNFIESERNKSLQEIRSNFDSKLKEFKKATELYAEKKHKENIEYLNQLTACKNKNLELDTTIHHLNQESKLQKEQLKQYENNIFKLQSKFDVFERLKPIFEEFFKEFPDQNPISVIQEIKDKREISHRMINDINDLTRSNHQLEMEKKEFIDFYEKKLSNLEYKLKLSETTNKEKDDQHQIEVKQLKSELKVFEEYKRENLKMNNMLFQVYNKLIERLKLSRDFDIEASKLPITEKDFEPNLFDNKEIIDYINSMLTTSSEELSSKMLRETIAYANMMLRTYLKDKLKIKFNPVETFKEIKNFIDGLTKQLGESEENRKKLHKDVTELNNKIKKMQNDIKYKEIQFEGLKKKFDLQINERIEKSRELRNQRIKDKENHRNNIHNRSEKNIKENDLKMNKSYIDVSESADSENEKSDRKRFETGKLSLIRSKNNIRSYSAMPKNKIIEEKNEVFLTDNADIEKKNETKKGRIKSGKSELTTRPNTCSKKANRPKTALIGYYLTHNQFFKKENFIDREDSEISPNKENREITKPNKRISKKVTPFSHAFKGMDNNEVNDNFSHTYNEKYNIKFKDMIIAKNNDKLIKTGGFSVLPAHSGALKNLVDQTNKLFLYKQKVTMKPESKNIFNKFHKNIENKFKILRGIKRDTVTNQYELGENIVSDINTMIKNLEKKVD